MSTRYISYGLGMSSFRETLTHVAPHLGLIYSMPVHGGPTEITSVRDLTWGEAERRWGTDVADALGESYPEIPRDLPAVQRASQYREYAAC